MSDWNGVPDNPSADGWHWLHHPEDLRPIPAMWNAELQGWTCGSLHSPGGIVELGYRYLGPALLPAEVAAREAAAAEAMREACVGKLEEKRRRVVKHYGLGDEGQELRFALHDMIEAVRSLPIPSASALAERDERMREEGRREERAACAKIASETPWGAWAAYAIHARSEGKG